jgi:hypothetical protein
VLVERVLADGGRRIRLEVERVEQSGELGRRRGRQPIPLSELGEARFP